MKNLLWFLILLISVSSYAQTKDNPLANEGSMIVTSNVRFTVLTPELIRMEWDSLGKFEDKASLVIINRNLPVPRFTKVETGNWLIIKTDQLVLKYKKGSGKFTPGNLQISFTGKNNKTIWKPGTPNNGNLKGTYRTLDGCDGNIRYDRQEKPSEIILEDGLISKDGWFLWDDSRSFLFDDSDWNWVQTRPIGNRQDWYYFGYSTNYKTAIYDYTLVAGKIPMPPRFAFGYWWSRYWNYSDQEIRDLVGDLERNQIPIDVLVIDMDWHLVQNLRNHSSQDEFGQRLGWTGYTWNRDLFPDPAKFLKWTVNKELKTTLNLHPASGIAPYEEKYTEFAKAMNFDTTGQHNIPFECADKKFMENLFKIVLHPFQDQGVSFWWLDWQQWPYSKIINGLSNTWWLNYCFFTDMERYGNQRPLLYHRWGGMGNHRYQIGFSGDTRISWKSLDYQPYFTSTASNVGYGYWSHDIGGHMTMYKDTVEFKNPELYTRWLQFATFSPIFRTHSTMDSRIKKEVWVYPVNFRNPMFEAIDLRYALAPYIYTMARRAHDTGISICHPLYYEYPELQEAYEFKNEYYFGDDMIVLPVTSPIKDNFAITKVWLPEGDWYEWFTGTLLKGGQVYERKFTLNEIPVYIKAGAIIPMYPKVKNLQHIINDLILRIYPGGSFETKLYEDNGNDKEYLNNGFAFTHLKSERNTDGSLSLTIFPREGSYKDMNDTRNYEIQLYGNLIPETITVNDKKIDYSYEKTDNTWNYSGKDLTVHLYIPNTKCSEKIEIKVTYSSEATKKQNITNGLIGRMNHLRICSTLLKPEGAMPSLISQCDILNMSLEYNPKNSIFEIETFNNNYPKLPGIIQAMQIKDESVRQNVLDYFK